MVAAAGVAGPDLGVFANYGVLGILTSMLLGFALFAWKREITRADRLEQELREQNKAMQDKIIPALVSAAAALDENAQLVREMAADRERDLRRQLDRAGS